MEAALRQRLKRDIKSQILEHLECLTDVDPKTGEPRPDSPDRLDAFVDAYERQGDLNQNCDQGKKMTLGVTLKAKETQILVNMYASWTTSDKTESERGTDITPELGESDSDLPGWKQKEKAAAAAEEEDKKRVAEEMES